MVGRDTRVLIVGAGPVGLAVAALLKQHGLDVLIIDRAEGPTPYSKAIGVHARTLESMHTLGIAQDLVSSGNPMSAYRVNDGGRAIMAASFAGIASPYPFVLGLPQSRTERRLLDRFTALGGEVSWQTQLVKLDTVGDRAQADAPAVAHIQRKDGPPTRIECRWIIGADGSRSTVREAADIAFPGGDYGRAFILGDVEIDWDGPRYDLQFFLSPNGYLLLVPMPDGLFRIIAQTDLTYDDFHKGERPQTTLEDLQNIVNRNGPGGIRVHSPRWLTSAPFYHRLAESPLKGRVILAGDSFHLFSPLGAQGLNTGFQDAFNLSWKLAFIEKGWADVGLLETYAQERLAIARLIMGVTTRTTRYITAKSWPTRMLRRYATLLANPTKRVQQQLPHLLAGLGQRYAATGRLAGPQDDGLPEPGTRLPHAWLADGTGYRPVADLVHGRQFTVLHLVRRLDADTAREIAGHWPAARRHRRPYVEPVVVARELAADVRTLVPGLTIVEDRLGGLRDRWRFGGAATIVVRPDGYCAAAIDGLDPGRLDSFFDTAIGPAVTAGSATAEDLPDVA